MRLHRLAILFLMLSAASPVLPGGEGPPAKGSAYVALDSWIYPALDRLAALGLVPSQISGLRPWTRAECRRQALEAARALERGPEADDLVRRLVAELEDQPGGTGAVLESVFLRNGAIAGPILNDSLHFGQTWSGDFGRPFGRGWNLDAGFSAHAEAGRFFAAVRGEYQHAPGRDPYPLAVRQTIAQLDSNPVEGPDPKRSVDRFEPVELYAGVRWSDLEISAGRQSLWWGPTYGAPLSFSNNAEPTTNLKFSTVHPILVSGAIEVRGEFVIGKLGGQKYTWRPWFNAQKLSFKVTGDLEIGFTRWSIFWGVGHSMTIGSLVRNFTSAASPIGPGGVGATDPGDRKGGFDFRYRIPGVRNWLTLYSDSYCDDDPSPLAAPRRAAISPGIYLTRVPGVRHLDFRAEAASTTPMGWDMGGWFNYINSQYHSGNTNYGYLLGNPAGRDGRALQAWSTYWLTPQSTVQIGFRQSKTSAHYLPGGGTQTDATLKGSIELGRSWHADVAMQYERFLIPVLGGPQRNVSGWLTLRWEPNLRLSH